MSMTCKINKSEIPGGPLSFFHALFGRCTAFYGRFLVDVVTSEGSTCILSSTLRSATLLKRDSNRDAFLEHCKSFKNTYFEELLPTAVSVEIL